MHIEKCGSGEALLLWTVGTPTTIPQLLVQSSCWSRFAQNLFIAR